MQKKTKQRLLGLIVVVGLIIILIPFFQTKNTLPSEAENLKVPLFPEQTMEVKASQPTVEQAINPAPSVVAENEKIVLPAPAPAAVPAEDGQGSAVQTNEVAQQPVALLEKKPILEKKVEKKASSIEKPKQVTNNKMTHYTLKSSSTHFSLDNNGLIKLKNAAWVIQVGTYKNKVQAVRIVNHLRFNGYPAFIQHISLENGQQHTQVFVGPEAKRVIAHQLAKRLEADLHIHGIVINYKPLAL